MPRREESHSGHNLHSSRSHRYRHHYPPGASKWNPIEHRLFSQIGKNWAGVPLTDIDKILKFIRTTKTESGLTVNAYLIPENYDTGIQISDAEMR